MHPQRAGKVSVGIYKSMYTSGCGRGADQGQRWGPSPLPVVEVEGGEEEEGRKFAS